MHYLYVDNTTLLNKAHELAAFTNDFTVITIKPETNQLYLQLDLLGLSVVSTEFKPLYLKEIYAKLGIRQQNLANELLIQAIKINTKAGSSVWDLTAGLGKDAFILSSFGYQVTMVEQNPVLATMLYYALSHKIIPPKNLKLVFGNSQEFLAKVTDRPNIIYLDPMFKDNKAAKAKKDMQIIQMLDSDSVESSVDELFNLSYATVLNKVIVKRDNKQENIVASPKPSYTKSGKTIRFDIYQSKTL
jgi:16S rRNA (guanine1516-N2)-methyltransferase